MRVSYDWLKDYINPGISAEELAELLTLSGVEAGAVETFGSPLPMVVVGEVKAMELHPGRSNLTLVDTDIGDQVVKIVCGAKNMQVGDRVPTAKPGAELPGGRKIDAVDIHGVNSPGMLCSAQELGLELGSEDEILILDQVSKPGEPVEQLLGYGDRVIVLELTPDRPDCLSMIGVAHEIAALTGKEVTMPRLSPPETGPDLEESFKVAIANSELCPRYTARAVEEVKVGRSPLWMQIRLLKAGIRPINNIVDITNYVMWEFGQPLHAFDLELLGSDEILVRRAGEGEKVITLDGVERKLTPEALVITDGSRPVALAGVMGGEETEINEATRKVLIEAASFNPTNIRRTARRYNLPSEASQRFEKGVNPEAVTWSQDRAALLMHELAGGRVLRGIVDRNEAPSRECRIAIDPEKINRVLGLDLEKELVIKILTRLGFFVQETNRESLDIAVPLRRGDVRIEEDIIEEVARLYGYDKIPLTLPRGELLGTVKSYEEKVHDLVRAVITACGYHECITHSFINPANLARFRFPEDDPRMRPIPVRNPFSEEQAVMRTTLLPGLLKTVQHNYSHRELDQMIFEMGAVFEANTLPLEDLPEERMKLGLAVTGQIPEPNWFDPSREADFFAIKGALETLFKRLQVEGVSFIPHAMPFSHPARCALITIKGVDLGYLGQLHPDIIEAWEIEQPVTVCEIDLPLLCDMATLVPRVTPLPRFPAAKRDLAIVVPGEIPAEKLEMTIRDAGGELVNQVRLFDLYEGKQIPEGKKSLAYSITFRREEGTLTEAEINRAQAKIEQALFDLGAVLRS